MLVLGSHNIRVTLGGDSHDLDTPTEAARHLGEKPAPCASNYKATGRSFLFFGGTEQLELDGSACI